MCVLPLSFPSSLLSHESHLVVVVVVLFIHELELVYKRKRMSGEREGYEEEEEIGERKREGGR